jgi:hypothetical protein
LKKKKSSKKKKAAFDLEAFEKELNESQEADKEGAAAGDDDEDEDQPTGKHLENIDEAELGDDPFAQGDAPVGVDAGNEPWLKSDRDYLYTEVSSALSTLYNFVNSDRHLRPHSSSAGFTRLYTLQTLRYCLLHPANVIQSLLPRSTGKATRNPFLPMLPTFASGCTGSQNMLSSSYLLRWVRPVQ